MHTLFGQIFGDIRVSHLMLILTLKWRHHAEVSESTGLG
jgi:hypothetical protein